MLRKVFLIASLSLHVAFAQSTKEPTFEEVLSLRYVSGASISPDGRHIVYSMRSVDWEYNRYDREIWLSKDGGEAFQITNNPKNSSTSPKWSPDSKWIAFLSNRGGKTQIHAIRADGGEAFPVTRTKGNISSFEWSPDGAHIAFLQSEDKSKEDKKRKEKYGAFAVEDAEYSLVQMWLTEFDPASFGHMPLPSQAKDSVYKDKMNADQLLDSVDFSIRSFEWSPDGKKIAFEHAPRPGILSFFKADISIYDLASQKHRVLVNNPSVDGLVDWSPDGKAILYQSSVDDSVSNFYRNGKLFRVDIASGQTKQLAKDFDEEIFGLSWNEAGIFAIAWQKSKRPMLHIDPKSGKANILDLGMARIGNYSFSKDNKNIAFTAGNDHDLTEVYTAEYPIRSVKAISRSSNQVKDWALSQSEMINWKSEDGQEIEGVLHKPQDYEPGKKYPLMVIIHGGPTGISTPSAAPSSVYPMLQWLNKGALILQPNYRGSAGYGEKFRSLNVRNLGVGDAWDVLSGVEYLVDQGMVDADKVGCMGWSQGGYISAFLTTNSDVFQAISVGAGISNWMTYYVNTDIHPFTRQYLKATPWSDKEIYERTSPMTNINQAKTPTLIQHGEFDRRVPTPNAYELYQGLQDVGVDTKLIIYKGFGHGISKPKERLAANWHNWQWFGKYIWGEEIEMPEE